MGGPGLSTDRGGEGRTLLIVDDQDFFHRLVTVYLEGTDIVVRAARSAETAWSDIAATMPDLVVTDAHMPGGMSGFDLCRRLKADPQTAAVPVVILSAMSERDDRIRGYEAGADDFFSKGMDREEFLARVRSLLQLHRMRRELAAAQLEMEVSRSQQLREAFERYVSPKLVARILATPGLAEQASLDRSIRCRATVLFADLRGFTRMSEQLSADTVVELLNQYFSLLVACAHQHDGTIFNMAGDNLLVGFNVPVEQPDATRRAIDAARQMIGEFSALAAEWQQRYGIETGLGIGINEGDAVAGNVGAPSYMNYTLIGDTVNTAARICERARAGELLFSEPVMGSLATSGLVLPAIELPPVQLKGKHDPIRMYCLPAARRQG